MKAIHYPSSHPHPYLHVHVAPFDETVCVECLEVVVDPAEKALRNLGDHPGRRPRREGVLDVDDPGIEVGGCEVLCMVGANIGLWGGGMRGEDGKGRRNNSFIPNSKRGCVSQSIYTWDRI